MRPGAFFGLISIDIDPTNGDLYIATNGQVGKQPDEIAHGTTLQKYGRERKLRWTRFASEFVTVGDFDPAEPDTRIYTSNAVFVRKSASDTPAARRGIGTR